MNVKVQSVQFDADQKLLDYVDKKVGKLSQMADNILSAEVILRLDKSETNEKKIAEAINKEIESMGFLDSYEDPEGVLEIGRSLAYNCIFIRIYFLV